MTRPVKYLMYMALDSIEVDEKIKNCFMELCCIANECGFVDYKMDDDTAEMLIKLVKLAEKYKDEVPNGMRM